MFNDPSFQYPLNEAWAIKKRQRKDGMPKKHDPKKMDTSMSMKKKKERKYIQPCPHVIQIKEREIIKHGVLFLWMDGME